MHGRRDAQNSKYCSDYKKMYTAIRKHVVCSYSYYTYIGLCSCLYLSREPDHSVSSGGAYRFIMSALTERVWCNAYSYFVRRTPNLAIVDWCLTATQEVLIGTDVIEIRSPIRNSIKLTEFR